MNYYGPSFGTRPDRMHFVRGSERTVVASIVTRIAIDVCSININHCRLDEDGRFKEVIPSSLNSCLTLSANTDQTGRAFMQDVVMSMLDEGCVAIVPVDTDSDPNEPGGTKILSLRTGKITEWMPDRVRVNVYNELVGRREEVILPKARVAIVENPLYAVFNEPNSTMQRLIRKLSLLDMTDEETASGKLNLLFQLPYAIKTDLKRGEAEKRRNTLEAQLSKSKYGIGYIDATEKVTQLNRPLENGLMGQVEYLTSMLYSQLGITTAILDGTADDKTMLNYYSRTIEPLIAAITDEMKRKFLTQTARTQGQSILFFRDPFKLVPVSNIAEIADKFTRNEIMTSNEIRQAIGMKPADDPKADMLVNSNLNMSDEEIARMEGAPIETMEGDDIQNGT